MYPYPYSSQQQSSYTYPNVVPATQQQLQRYPHPAAYGDQSYSNYTPYAQYAQYQQHPTLPQPATEATGGACSLILVD